MNQKTFGKVISLLLCIAMVLGCLSMVTFATETAVAYVGETPYDSLWGAFKAANGAEITSGVYKADASDASAVPGGFEIDKTKGTININDKEAFLYYGLLFNGTNYNGYVINLNCDIDFDNATVKNGFNLWTYFEGNNHTVSNIKVDGEVGTPVGFFNQYHPQYDDAVDKGAVIRNLTLDNVKVVAEELTKSHTDEQGNNSMVGILVGHSNADIDNITIKNSSVTNGKYTGGVIGHAYCNITNCTLDKVTVVGQYKCGGIVGFTPGDASTIAICFNTLSDVEVSINYGYRDEGKAYLGTVIGHCHTNNAKVFNNTLNNVTGSQVKIGLLTEDLTIDDTDKAAQIGSTYYATLAEAIAAAKNGNTTAEKTITIIGTVGAYDFSENNSGITFLGGKTGKVTGSWRVQGSNTDMSNITIKGLKFVEGGNIVFSTATSDFRNLHIEDCTFTGTGADSTPAISLGIGVAPYDGIVIKNNTISDYSGALSSAIIINNDNGNTYTGTITVEKNTVTNFGHNGVQLVLAPADVIIKDNAFTRTNSKDVLNLNTAKSVTVTGNTFTVPADYSTGNQIVWNTNAGALVDVTDNTFVKGTANVTDIATLAPHLAGYQGTFVGYGIVTDNDGMCTDGYLFSYTENVPASSIVAEGYEAIFVAKYESVYTYHVESKNAKVAQIGDVKYSTLAEALNACKSGETVVLLDDITLTENWTPVSGFNGTLNGNNHTISGLTVTAANYAGLFASINGATIKDLTISGADITSNGNYAAVLAAKAANSTITNVTITGSKVVASGEYAGAVFGSGYSKVSDCTVTNNTVTATEQVGGLAGYVWLSSIYDNTVTGNTVTATAQRAGGMIGKLQVANLNLGPDEKTIMIFNNNTVSGTVNGGAVGGGLIGQIMGDDSRYEIKNNDITTVVTATTSNPIATLRSDSVQGANFVNNLAANITGNGWVGDNSFDYVQGTVTQTILNKNAKVAKIGDVEYSTLAEAIAAVPTDSTETLIVMIADEEIIGNEGVTVASTQNVKLDLNGHVISNVVNENAHAQVIKNNGTLTIIDSTDTNADGTGTGLIKNTVDEGSQAGDWFSTPQYNWTTNVVDNNGILTIKSGKLENTALGSICYAVDNNGADGYSPVLNLEGGLLKNVNYTPVRLAPATNHPASLNMTGGIIEGKYGIALNCNNMAAPEYNVSITGGSVKASSYAFYQSAAENVNDITKVNISISGGKFGVDANDGTLISASAFGKFISGGIFTKDISAYAVDGYEVVANTDANTNTTYPYATAEAAYVAQIGDNKFETIAEALKAAKDNDVIEILNGTWGADSIGSLTVAEANAVRYKSLTIQPATGATVTLTADLYLGYDDSSTANASMTVKNINFVNASLTVSNYVNATVEGCTFTGSGSAAGALVVMDSCCTKHKTAEEYPASSVTIKDCTINGTDTEKPGIRLRNTGDVTLTGNTISNAKHNGILFESNSSIDATPAKTITISGNTITEWNYSNVDGGGRAIRAALGNLAAGSTVTIQNNTFVKAVLGKDEPDFVKISEATNATVALENNNWNGAHQIEVSGNDAYYTVNGNTPAITAVVTEKTPVAYIGNNVYTTLADAVAAATSGDTITLLADAELSAELVINKNITLDLNGFDVDAKTFSICIDNGSLNVTGEGKISGAPSKLKLIYLVGSTDSTAENYSNVTIGENVTVNCTNGYAIMLSAKDNKGFGVNITVNGTVEGYYGALYINGSVSPTTGNVPTVTLGSTGKLITNEESAAIFAAGYGIWNLAGDITGGTAIYAKSGIINITGGTLTATGAKVAYTYHVSGYEPTGDTIVSDNCGYPGGAPVITITGGTFVTANGKQIGAYAGNGVNTIAPTTATSNTLTAPEGYIWKETATAGVYKLVEYVEPVKPIVEEETIDVKVDENDDTPANEIAEAAVKTVVDEIIKEIKDNTQVAVNNVKNIVTNENNDESTLKIVLKNIAVETTSTSQQQVTEVTTNSIKYDVKPIFIITDTQGNVTEQTVTNDELAVMLAAAGKTAVTFRLAVPANIVGDYVEVSHYPDGETTPDWTKSYAVQGTGTERYVEISASSFSGFEIKSAASATYVAKNVNTSVFYSTLEDALDEAASGEKIQLLADISGEKYVTVETGITLDLNGHDITGAKLIYVTGTIIDTAATRGFVRSNGYFFASSQTYAPIYNEAKDGYSFYLLGFSGKNTVYTASTHSYQFTLNTSKQGDLDAAFALLKSNTTELRFQAVISITWTQENMSVSKTFTYTDAHTQKVINGLTDKDFVLYTATFSNLPAVATLQAKFLIYDANGKVMYTINGKAIEING